MKKLLFFILFLVACKPSHSPITIDVFEGTWLGHAQEIDPGVYRPFTEFIEVNDSLEVRFVGGSWETDFDSIKMDSDTLYFAERKFPLDAVELADDRLAMGKFYPYQYIKVEGRKIDLDSTQIIDNLLPGQWKYGDEILHFSGDTLWVGDLSTMERRQHCWDVKDMDGYKFIHRKGNFKYCDWPHFPFYMIDSISKDELTVQTNNDGNLQQKTYHKLQELKSDLNVPSFQLCNPFLYENARYSWYFYKYTSFEGGLYALRKVFNDRYQIPRTNRDELSGHIRVQFVVNCEGKVGMFEAKGMDMNFKETSDLDMLVQQIVTILESSGTWIPGTSGNYEVDTYKYLIFKIRNGEIDEIYP